MAPRNMQGAGTAVAAEEPEARMSPDLADLRSEYEGGYFHTRFGFDERRDVVWREVCRYLQRYVRPDGRVLDLGAGYCNFINNIRAGEKHAVDLFPELPRYAAPGVITHLASCTALGFIPDARLDVVFASNLFEHLTREDLATTLREVRRVLRAGGKLIALQPNFRLCYKTYFDDYTHLQIFTDRSLADVFETSGFDVVDSQPRFLPVNMKSTLRVPIPKLDWCVRAYLALPWRPRAGQMLMVGERRAGDGR